MPGQALVTINTSQWSVNIASTPAEITQGLSGVLSIPASTGVLFDLSVNYSEILINMSQMLFALDIVFINSTGGVIGILRNVQPGVDVNFSDVSGARYFLEMNAGEAAGISIGDAD